MGDMGDIFNAWNKAKQKKRNANLDSSEKILLNHKIPFKKCNEYHFLVCGKVDFWPTTGKYRFRDSNKYKRGVFNLIKELTK